MTLDRHLSRQQYIVESIDSQDDAAARHTCWRHLSTESRREFRAESISRAGGWETNSVAVKAQPGFALSIVFCQILE
jgi:hypothetical protein